MAAMSTISMGNGCDLSVYRYAYSSAALFGIVQSEVGPDRPPVVVRLFSSLLTDREDAGRTLWCFSVTSLWHECLEISIP